MICKRSNIIAKIVYNQLLYRVHAQIQSFKREIHHKYFKNEIFYIYPFDF